MKLNLMITGWRERGGIPRFDISYSERSWMYILFHGTNQNEHSALTLIPEFLQGILLPSKP